MLSSNKNIRQERWDQSKYVILMSKSDRFCGYNIIQTDNADIAILVCHIELMNTSSV